MTGQPAYTDADAQAAAATWWAGNGYAWSDEIDDDDKPFLLSEFRAVLDAVVPSIVARAKAEAWDEAAEATADWMWNNPSPSGIPHDPPRNPYADEIEAGR